MMSTTSRTEPRTYGGWRRRRAIGLLGLGTGGTLALMGALVLVIVSGAVSLHALLVAGPCALVVGALTVVRVHGVPLGQLALQHSRWWYAAKRGYTKYTAGVVIDHPRAFQLPGVLAPTTLLSAEDGLGGRYGLVWDRRTGLLTATLRVVPTSTWLAERADTDQWVANWGSWLAGLGHMPMIRWVTVTCDTAPEPGYTLTNAVASSLAPDAPPQARDILHQLVLTAPNAAADVDTRVSITFDPSASPAAPKDLTAAAAEVGRALQGLESALGTCGVTVVGRATADEIAGFVRTAFDPHARGEINRLLERHRGGPTGSDAESADGIGYMDAGPVGAEDHYDRYVHDGGVSVTWAWHEAPRSNVHADVLARLVSPGLFAKRVTMQYRPLPAMEATRVLESEVNAATFRRHYRNRTGRDETARDAHDQARAQQAAAEEAMGAGVVLLALYVTTTVTSDGDLPRAVSDTEASAEASRIRLRRMWNSQAAAFAATLPCGICPAELARRWPH
ncbi:SCO6880 family protein [Actinomadura sp. NPDC048955]|uniref:SCO6880 family protein n=1 Tax=Actinomadura sp. NPDC048955 TaxID=3158228 RepID=UPI0034077563